LAPVQRGVLVLALLGLVLGWVLLLDTLALLPLAGSVYAWGFDANAVAVAALLACLPWLAYGGVSAGSPMQWSALLALVLFVALRLPSGNVWDALLDPWLWLALHVAVLRWIWPGARQQAG
ncbi:MAG: hypothetical protein ACR2I0_06765, partial [Rhodoferax sp.]